MPASGALTAALERRLGERVSSTRPVSGGDINDAWMIETAGGRRLFVKTRADATAAEFDAEAAGLAWLADGGARVPEAVAVGGVEGSSRDEPPYLALEWIETGGLSPAGAERLGIELARLHSSGAPAHGWLPAEGPQRLGSVELPSQPGDSWPEVYVEQRLLPLARMARDLGRLDPRGAEEISAVCERIEDLAGPPEPPARLHGDLWGGNVLADSTGRGWLIDPAAHGGHREMDLAMLRLFGAPSPRIAAAYAEAFPPAPGWRERIGLWQLQPLLVHAVLFGGGYGRSARTAARVYL